MKQWYTLLFFLMTLTASAQEVFKTFEVQTQAQPVGGLPMLEKFIEVNRRVPYAAEVANVKGTVYVAAVVGTNGRISNVTLVRGLHPACDREAIRVMSLFNAWKPAQKDGKDVLMEFTYGIKFSPVRTGCTPEGIITYYDAKGVQVVSEGEAQFRFFQPVDSLGYPNGHPELTKRKGDSWKKADERFTLHDRRQIRYNYEEPTLPDSLTVRHVTLLSLNNRLQGSQYAFYDNGQPYSLESYNDGEGAGVSLFYYPNGMVRRADDQLVGGGIREWNWHPNGQLRQVALRNVDNKPFVLLNQWDSLGNQTVREGTGTARIANRISGLGWVTETGRLTDSQNDGLWTASLADGKPYYRERWEKGRFLSGVSFDAKGDSIVYSEPFNQPVFQGGLEGMYRFLSQNIRYPSEATRYNIQGRVFVSFVVCTDGTLCDYQVLRGAHPLLDEEAMRVVKKMSGKWKPGIQRGSPVRVKYNLPINFSVN